MKAVSVKRKREDAGKGRVGGDDRWKGSGLSEG